jgi:uncharacterized membrane protein YbhN (UPF0104 family)
LGLPLGDVRNTHATRWANRRQARPHPCDASETVNRALLLAKRLWPAALALVACAYGLRQFDWRSVGDALAGLPLAQILLETAAIALAVFLACALRWIAVNKLPWRLPTIVAVYLYMSVVIGASMATPMQLGEVLKVKFAHDSGLPLGSSVANLGYERIIDLGAISAMAVGGLVFAARHSIVLATVATSVTLAAGVIVQPVLYWGVARFADSRTGERLRRVAGEPLQLSSLALVALFTIVKWGLTLLVWMLLTRAVGVRLDIGQSMLVVGSVTALTILSMVPAGIGVQEVSVRSIMITMGVEPAQAEAAAIVLRILTPVMIILGVLHLPFIKQRQKPIVGTPSDV